MIDRFIELETAIGYSFKDRRLLEQALVHASANVSPQEVREGGRISWLGDAILQMVVSEIPFETHGEARKEELHQMREWLTENTTLGRVGSRLGIEGCDNRCVTRSEFGGERPTQDGDWHA